MLAFLKSAVPAGGLVEGGWEPLEFGIGGEMTGAVAAGLVRLKLGKAANGANIEVGGSLGQLAVAPRAPIAWLKQRNEWSAEGQLVSIGL